MAETEVRGSVVIELILKNMANADNAFRRVGKNLEWLDKQSKFLNKTMNGQAQRLVNNATHINALGRAHDSLAGSIGMNFEKWVKFNKEGGKFNSVGGRVGNNLRMMTHGLRGFRMEMLGVMFFGMMLAKTFTQMLKPAMDMFGVFELWTVTLQVMFLPIMELIFPLLLGFMQFFINMPKELQVVIGIFALLMVGLGTFLMLIGQLALGIGSFILILPILGAIGTIIGVVTAVFAGLALIIAGIVQIFKGKFQGIGLVLMGIGVILLLFIGWWALIPIAVGAAVYLIIKHWTSVKTFFLNMWEGIKTIFKDAWTWIETNVINPFINSKFISTVKDIAGSVGGFFSNGFDGGKTGETSSVDDFIWRPGSGPVSINPNDTLIGSKGGMAGGGATINQTINVTASNREEIERLIRENNRTLVSDIQRYASTG